MRNNSEISNIYEFNMNLSCYICFSNTGLVVMLGKVLTSSERIKPTCNSNIASINVPYVKDPLVIL